MLLFQFIYYQDPPGRCPPRLPPPSPNLISPADRHPPPLGAQQTGSNSKNKFHSQSFGSGPGRIRRLKKSICFHSRHLNQNHNQNSMVKITAPYNLFSFIRSDLDRTEILIHVLKKLKNLTDPV